MSTPELQNLLIRHILGIGDPRVLSDLLAELESYGERGAPSGASVTLHEPPAEYSADASNPTGVSEAQRPDPDEVLGYRPDGTPVTIANSAADWGRALDDFPQGKNSRPASEVYAEIDAKLL